jgi:cell division protein ZipA
MELTEMLNMDVLKLTIAPGIIVLAVLILWFKRSGPKVSPPRERDYFGDGQDSERDMGDMDFLEDDTRFGDAASIDDLDDPLFQPGIARKRGEPAIEAEGETQKPHYESLDSPYASEADSDDILMQPVGGHKQPATTEPEPAPTANPGEPGLILVLNIIAEGRQLRGPAILKAIAATGMAYGAMGVFHFYSANRPGKQPLFSLANMMEPGSFNLSSMEELSTPGLTLFATLSRPNEALATFNKMLDVARKLAKTLDATVCDERRGTLNKQGVEHIHEQIKEYQRKSRITQAQHAHA